MSSAGDGNIPHSRHRETPAWVSDLKIAIENTLHDKLIFRAAVQLVPEGTLPRYEYKAKLIRKIYEA